MPAHSWPRGDGLKLTKDDLPAIREAFAASPLADKIYFDEDLPGFGLRCGRAASAKSGFAVTSMPAFNAS